MLLFLPNKLLNKMNGTILNSILLNSLNKYPPLNPTIPQFLISTHQPSQLDHWQDGAFSAAKSGEKRGKYDSIPFTRGFVARQKANYRESSFSLDPQPPPSPPPRCLNVSFGNANGKGLLKYGRMKNENRKNPKSQGLFRYFSLSFPPSLFFFSAVSRREGGGVWKEGGAEGRGIQVITRRLAQTRLKSPKPLK